MTLPTSLFITGTDTNVGKTLITAFIAAGWLQQQKTVAIYKPVQTGVTCLTQGDAHWIANELGYPQGLTIKTSYHFEAPAAPTVADPAGTIDLSVIINDYKALASTHNIVLVEGAGGVLCPIKGWLFMADLARHLKLPALLVTRPNLGTINHTLLSLEVLRARGVTPYGILINEGQTPLSPEEKDSLAVKTVAQQLLQYSGIKLLPSLPTLPTPLSDVLADIALPWLEGWYHAPTLHQLQQETASCNHCGQTH